ITRLPEVLPADPRIALFCSDSIDTNPDINEPALFESFGAEETDSAMAGEGANVPGFRLLAAADNAALTSDNKSVRISYYSEQGYIVNRVSAQTGCPAEAYPEGFMGLYQFMEEMVRKLKAQKNVARGEVISEEESSRLRAEEEPEIEPEPGEEEPETESGEEEPETEPSEEEPEPEPGEEQPEPEPSEEEPETEPSEEEPEPER
ncbi:MAG: hypothetical protein ACOC2C_06250, partial [Cyclonatronaceae bacterium]